jgi:hypothetical protein
MGVGLPLNAAYFYAGEDLNWGGKQVQMVAIEFDIF